MFSWITEALRQVDVEVVHLVDAQGIELRRGRPVTGSNCDVSNVAKLAWWGL